MGVKFLWTVAAILVALTCAVDARHHLHRSHYEDDGDYEDQSVVASEHYPYHPAATIEARSIKQGRVLPGVIAVKKLVLLKFKKIVPISLILLKSSNENEAELVPVYPTSEIPANVQFIPTPNGISGHKDVQAVAIPNELHEQLQVNGLANLENIEALLNEAQEPSPPAVAVDPVQLKKDDEPLNVNEADEDQLLEGVSQEKPAKVATPLRRIAADDITKPGIKSTPQTAVEEIPLYLYSAKDTPQVLPSTGRKVSGRRHFIVGRHHFS